MEECLSRSLSLLASYALPESELQTDAYTRRRIFDWGTWGCSKHTFDKLEISKEVVQQMRDSVKQQTLHSSRQKEHDFEIVLHDTCLPFGIREDTLLSRKSQKDVFTVSVNFSLSHDIVSLIPGSGYPTPDGEMTRLSEIPQVEIAVDLKLTATTDQLLCLKQSIQSMQLSKKEREEWRRRKGDLGELLILEEYQGAPLARSWSPPIFVRDCTMIEQSAEILFDSNNEELFKPEKMEKVFTMSEWNRMEQIQPFSFQHDKNHLELSSVDFSSDTNYLPTQLEEVILSRQRLRQETNINFHVPVVPVKCQIPTSPTTPPNELKFCLVEPNEKVLWKSSSPITVLAENESQDDYFLLRKMLQRVPPLPNLTADLKVKEIHELYPLYKPSSMTSLSVQLEWSPFQFRVPPYKMDSSSVENGKKLKVDALDFTDVIYIVDWLDSSLEPELADLAKQIIAKETQSESKTNQMEESTYFGFPEQEYEDLVPRAPQGFAEVDEVDETFAQSENELISNDLIIDEKAASPSVLEPDLDQNFDISSSQTFMIPNLSEAEFPLEIANEEDNISFIFPRSSSESLPEQVNSMDQVRCENDSSLANLSIERKDTFISEHRSLKRARNAFCLYQIPENDEEVDRDDNELVEESPGSPLPNKETNLETKKMKKYARKAHLDPFAKYYSGTTNSSGSTSSWKRTALNRLLSSRGISVQQSENSTAVKESAQAITVSTNYKVPNNPTTFQSPLSFPCWFLGTNDVRDVDTAMIEDAHDTLTARQLATFPSVLQFTSLTKHLFKSKRFSSEFEIMERRIPLEVLQTYPWKREPDFVLDEKTCVFVRWLNSIAGNVYKEEEVYQGRVGENEAVFTTLYNAAQEYDRLLLVLIEPIAFSTDPYTPPIRSALKELEDITHHFIQSTNNPPTIELVSIPLEQVDQILVELSHVLPPTSTGLVTHPDIESLKLEEQYLSVFSELNPYTAGRLYATCGAVDDFVQLDPQKQEDFLLKAKVDPLRTRAIVEQCEDLMLQQLQASWMEPNL